MAKEIVEIPTERLLPNPYQPRKQFSSEEMLGLADSIQQNGVLQPLLARRINNSDYYELIAGEVLGSVEAHMLQEVGETALVVVLKNRSDLLGDEEVCLTLGGLVVAAVVVQAVGEHPVAHLRVGGQFVGLLGEAGEGHHGHRESGEQRFEVEFHWICKLNG